MADVLIDKFRVKVVRQGTTPANPGNVTTDPLVPVNPPGTGAVPPISFLQLTDTPTTYASQALKVVRVNSGETGLEFTTVDVLGTVLTGYTVGSNTALAATDTILQAFGKVQGQINARVSGTIASAQVAFGTGVNTIGGGGLNWDNGLNTLTSTNAATFLITTVNQNLGITTTGNGNVNIIPDGTGNIGFKAGAQANSVVTINGDLGSGIRSNAISFSTARWFNIWHEGGSPRIGIFVEGNTSTNTMKWTHPSLRANYLSFTANFLDFNFTNPSTGIGNDITGPTALIRFDYANQRQGILTISPTNTLDVNGTARIRTVANATGNFVTLSATGVLQQRTAAEVVTDLGVGLWTLVGSDIFRNSSVAVGRNTIPTGSTFAVQSRTATSGDKFIQFLNNLGSELFSVQQDGTSFFNSSLLRVGNPSTDIAAQGFHIKGSGSTSLDVIFRVQNSSNSNVISAFGDGAFTTGVNWSFGLTASLIGGRGPSFKGTVNNTNSIFRVVNSSDQINLDINGDGSINIRSHLLRVGNPTAAIAQGATFKSSSNLSTSVAFRVMDSAEKDLFSIFSNGAIIRFNNPSTSFLTGFHYKGGFNDGTRIFNIDNSSDISIIEILGNRTINFADQANFVFNATTGTKIATATTQKLAFWNATPIVQPTTAIAAAAFVANTSGIVNDTATFGGYTLGQVVQALRNIGILA